MDFRPHFAALAARLESDLGAVLRSPVCRRNLPAKAFPEDKQPALVMLEESVGPVLNEPAPPLWELAAILLVHARVSGDSEVPGEDHLQLLSAVQSALRWRAGEPCSQMGATWTTLGGRVIRAWPEPATIDDDIYDPGQVTLTLHVRMLAHDED